MQLGVMGLCLGGTIAPVSRVLPSLVHLNKAFHFFFSFCIYLLLCSINPYIVVFIFCFIETSASPVLVLAFSAGAGPSPCVLPRRPGEVPGGGIGLPYGTAPSSCTGLGWDYVPVAMRLVRMRARAISSRARCVEPLTL